MFQPEGCIKARDENKACQLKKLLYGWKQAPKYGHEKFDGVITLSSIESIQLRDVFTLRLLMINV